MRDFQQWAKREAAKPGGLDDRVQRILSGEVKMAEDSQIPRRICLDRLTPAETAIVKAVESVEDLPPDTRLTEAVILLGQARAKVADFVDDK